MNFYLAQTNSPSPSLNDVDSAEKINSQLEKRYEGLIEEGESADKITPGENNALMKQLSEGKEMNLDQIRATGEANALDDKLNMFKQKGDNLATVGADSLDGTNGGVFTWSSPYVAGGGLVGVLALLWWLKSLDFSTNLMNKLVGEDGIYYQILTKLGKAKPKVSESDLFLYNKALEELRKYAKKAIDIDSDKFSGNEFLIFAKICYSFNKDVGDYEGLKPYLETLRSAIKAQASYLILGQVESTCRGPKQQEFYDYCHQLLTENIAGRELRQRVREKLQAVLNVTKTEVGQSNLESYTTEIENLADDPQAIAIMNRFKGEQIGDYATMKVVVDLISTFKEEEVIDLRTVMFTTMNYYDNFEHLADIINLPEEKRSPDTYARLLQYLALEQRHQWSFMQFQNLIEILRQWHKPFGLIHALRQKYPAEKFRRPAIFKEPIAGLSLYEKHRNSLVDAKTGHSFIAFEEETTEG
jgi:hypothetical protein